MDVFCGVGGLTYGLQQAGINVVAGLDEDETCKYAFTTKIGFYIGNAVPVQLAKVIGESIQKHVKENINEWTE